MRHITYALALSAAFASIATAQQPGDHDLELEFSINEQRLRETLDVDSDGLHGTGDLRLGTDDVTFYWLRNADTNLIRDNGDVIGAETGFRMSARFTQRMQGDDQLTTDQIRDAIDQNGPLFVGADLSGKLTGTKHGVGAEAAAGVDIPLNQPAGTIAQGQIPLKLDMKIVSIRLVTEGAVTQGGVSANGEAAFDIEWEGNIKTVSASVGAGANIFRGLKGKVGIEIAIDRDEFKAAMRRAKDGTKRVLNKAGELAKEAAEAVEAGAKRTKDVVTDYRGTPVDSDEPTATPPLGAPVDLTGQTPAEIAARFAPVIAQKLEEGSNNTLRAVNFDGDWDTRNNEEASEQAAADRTPVVYYDVKESATHYYVTYAFYFARQEAKNLLKWDVSNLTSRENDMEGMTIVARKGARAGEEIELMVTTQQDGTAMTRYASEKAYEWELKELPQGDKASRRGGPRFIDEVNHPHYDTERTHPQVYVTPRGHHVWAYNGRNDVNPFAGSAEGVVYHPALPAAAPSAGDTTGYELRPLAEVTANATIKDGERLRGGNNILNRNKAKLPSAWKTMLEGMEPGDLFNHPERTLNTWYEIPGAQSGMTGALPSGQ